MADASDDSDAVDVDWVFYRDRPEWKDVTPIPQEDGPHPIVKIAYSDKFKDIFDYFRAVLAKKEISERAFQLTEDAALANSSNYTTWHYRRILLKGLNKDLYAELKFVQAVIEDCPKNYQIWHHRQVLVEWLNDASFEKMLTERILMNDAKNYHAWQHRQWAIKKFHLFDGELEYINKLLDVDIRNNSAWNQRYFVLVNTKQLEDRIDFEIKFTLDKISKAPMNESAWNYLRGILQDIGLTKYSEVTEFTEKQFESGCRSPHLLGFMIDCLEERLLAGEDQQLCYRAIDLCEMLAKEHDTIRKEYWRYIARNLGNMYGPEEAHAQAENDENHS